MFWNTASLMWTLHVENWDYTGLTQSDRIDGILNAFLVINTQDSYLDLVEVCPRDSIKIILAAGNGLALNRYQTIFRSNYYQASMF